MAPISETSARLLYDALVLARNFGEVARDAIILAGILPGTGLAWEEVAERARLALAAAEADRAAPESSFMVPFAAALIATGLDHPDGTPEGYHRCRSCGAAGFYGRAAARGPSLLDLRHRDGCPVGRAFAMAAETSAVPGSAPAPDEKAAIVDVLRTYALRDWTGGIRVYCLECKEKAPDGDDGLAIVHSAECKVGRAMAAVLAP